MPTPAILVATWGEGLFAVAGKEVRQEIAGPVRGLTADGRGGALAIVGGNALLRRSAGGEWAEVMTSDLPLSCCVAAGDLIFAGTDDANVLRIDPDGVAQRLVGFDSIEGRDGWYAGAAVIDGKLMGPPLGIRSMAATCDGAALLANVHVGGIPRSTDSGLTWKPTIAVDSDVHQVCAHPTRPDIVIAAAAEGLGVSRDGGVTWTIETEGLHAYYCSGVAFAGDDLLVAASTDHFATRGAVYRRAIDGDGPLQRLGGGFPEWTGGIVDTDCIAARDGTIAAIDRSGSFYLSKDGGASWTIPVDPLPVPSGLLLL